MGSTKTFVSHYLALREKRIMISENHAWITHTAFPILPVHLGERFCRSCAKTTTAKLLEAAV